MKYNNKTIYKKDQIKLVADRTPNHTELYMHGGESYRLKQKSDQ